MATKKSMWALLGILVVFAWILGSPIQAGAETMKGRGAATVTKDESIPVSDEEGHSLHLQIMEGVSFFENGEIAKTRSHVLNDTIPGKGAQAIGYTIVTFEDGSTIVVRFQQLWDLSYKATAELIKGTGRFEGIKGTSSSTGKTFPPSKGEAMRVTSDFTWSYTLPTK